MIGTGRLSGNGSAVMKAIYVSVGLLVLLIVAVGCTGCTTHPAAAQAGNSGQGTDALATAAAGASSSQQAGSTVGSTSVFGTSYTWMEYRMTSSVAGNAITTDTKTERSTGDYQGKPAIHLRISTTSSSGGMTSINDVYYDTAMKSLLGGTMTLTNNGQTTTRDIPPAQLQNMQSANFNNDFTLTFAGVEPVSVPAGTYPAADKYTATVKNVGMTYWKASGVPVPVKWTSSMPQGSSTAELVGWG
jgi:hypothetical protein